MIRPDATPSPLMPRILTVLLLAALPTLASAQKTPRGFKRFENKHAGIHFCYPRGWKQIPVPADNDFDKAIYFPPKPPRELRKFKKFYKGAEPTIHVFVTNAKNVKKGSAMMHFLAKGTSIWEIEKVEGKPGHFRMTYPFTHGATGQKQLGYAIEQKLGDIIYGVHGYTYEAHDKTLRKLLETMMPTVRPTGAKHEVTDAALEQIYAGKSYKGIDRRKQVRKKLTFGWKVIDTENFIIVHNARSMMLVNRIARELEAMRRVFETLIPANRPLENVAVVRVCGSLEDYLRYGGSIGTTGYWSLVHLHLVVYDQTKTLKGMEKYMGKRTDRDSMATIFHEACHQYVYQSFHRVVPHYWFNEGIADYMSAAINPGVGNRLPRIGLAKRILLAKSHAGEDPDAIPLKELLHAEPHEFYDPRRVAHFYAAGWSFCYFMKKSPVVAKHARWSKFLDDYFAKLLAAYADELPKAQKNYRAQSKAHRPKAPKNSPQDPGILIASMASKPTRKTAIKQALEGIDLDELEREWKSFILAVKIPASMRKK